MIEVIRDGDIYGAFLRLSKGSKRVWIASPYLGRDAHNVFDRSFQSATDKRFLTDIASGCVDRLELSRLHVWAGKNVRTLLSLHAKIYVFDESAIITSANLSLRAFERNHEVATIFSGAEFGKARNAFSSLYTGGEPVTLKQITQLPKRKFAGTGAGGQKNLKHTVVGIWDSSSQGQDLEKLGVEDEPLAAPTCDVSFRTSARLSAIVDAELKRRSLRYMRWFISEFGLKRTRSLYGVGAVFDACDDAGTRQHIWRLGANRHIATVKIAFNISGHTVVVYRTARRYSVDGVLLGAARRLKVWSGRPNSFQLIEYRRLIDKRTKS